jgi:alcohol dehydrogenase YqhD (iron-dependent ADH family)
MWAGMMAHNNSCGVGRSQDWNSHNIEHELSALYDCAHGAGLAVTMPAVFRYVYKHDVIRFAKLATRVWGIQMDFENPERTALEGIDALAAFLKKIGMPGNFEELGAKQEDIPKLVDVLCNGNGRPGSISGFVTLNEEDCTKIYEMMV